MSDDEKVEYAGVLLAVTCDWCDGTGRILIDKHISKRCETCIGSGGRPKVVSFEEFIDILDARRREVIAKKVGG